VPAQRIEDSASARVATRDEVCRRRKLLRLAWARNQIWIRVPETAATARNPQPDLRGLELSRLEDPLEGHLLPFDLDPAALGDAPSVESKPGVDATDRGSHFEGIAGVGFVSDVGGADRVDVDHPS